MRAVCMRAQCKVACPGCVKKTDKHRQKTGVGWKRVYSLGFRGVGNTAGKSSFEYSSQNSLSQRGMASSIMAGWLPLVSSRG